MNSHKINWKLYFKNPESAKPEAFFKVFNTWIPNSPEVFVDVADYAHINDGPKILLYGHYVDYALDEMDRRLGFLYSKKRDVAGEENLAPLNERLKTTLSEFLKSCQRLTSDQGLAGLQFKTNELLFIINDRALAPNTVETFNQVKPALTQILDKIYGAGGFELKHISEPKKRFAVQIIAKKEPSLSEIISKV